MPYTSYTKAFCLVSFLLILLLRLLHPHDRPLLRFSCLEPFHILQTSRVLLLRQRPPHILERARFQSERHHEVCRSHLRAAEELPSGPVPKWLEARKGTRLAQLKSDR